MMPELSVRINDPETLPTNPSKQVYGSQTVEITPLPKNEGVWAPEIGPAHVTVVCYAGYGSTVALTGTVSAENAEEKLWPPKSSNPLTQEDLNEQVERRVIEVIFQIKMMRHLLVRERLANRLISLNEEAKEEEPGSTGIAIGSLVNFARFLTASKIKWATLSLTPEHEIYASWRFDKGQLLSIRFLADSKAHLVIFKFNEKHPEQKLRITMSLTTDMLIPSIESNGMLRWVME